MELYRIKKISEIIGVDPLDISFVKHPNCTFYYISNKSHKHYLIDQHLQILKELVGFYTQDILKKHIYPIVKVKVKKKGKEHKKKNESVSLRVIDWLVTNFSKSHNVSYTIIRNGQKEVVYLHNLYKSYLKNYRRRIFDPFRRKNPIFFFSELSEEPLSTTVGQLNFFKFALSYGILEYTKANLSILEKDMNECLLKSKILKNFTKKKRVSLSKKANTSCCLLSIASS